MQLPQWTDVTGTQGYQHEERKICRGFRLCSLCGIIQKKPGTAVSKFLANFPLVFMAFDNMLWKHFSLLIYDAQMFKLRDGQIKTLGG